MNIPFVAYYTLFLSMGSVVKFANSQREAAKPILYQITDGGTFQCDNAKERCTFRRSNVESVVANGGQISVDEQGNVWATDNPLNDTLTLGACNVTACYSLCNAGCNCTTPAGQTCMIPTSRAPTPSPTVTPPVQPICPQSENTQYCTELMSRVPEGNKFDCYNFCGGVFRSTCSFSNVNSCGNSTCSNATTGIDGLVLGCTDDDRNVNVPRQGGTSGACSLYVTYALMSMLAPLAWLGL